MSGEIVYKKRKSHALFLVVIFLFFIIFVLIAYYLYSINSAMARNGETKKFEILSGQSSTEISQNLEKGGLIKDAKVFEFFAWSKGMDERLQTGTHDLNTNQSLREILLVLTNVKRKLENEFTVIEGWRNSDIAESFAKNSIMTKSEFETMTVKKLLWWDEYEFLRQKPRNVDLEGYLFPDTYRVFQDAKPEDVIRKMLDNFKRKITPQMLQDVAAQKITLHEIITAASIVEMEVTSEMDRKKVAGIFYKRIENNIPLQADSTVNYITGKKTPAASLKDLEIDSPYNTYKYRGLPPGPINNPGLSAIMAAIYPEESPYWFFLTTPDGEVIYSKTFEEHVEAKRKYLR